MEVNEQLIRTITQAVVSSCTEMMRSPRQQQAELLLPPLPEEREYVRSIPTRAL